MTVAGHLPFARRHFVAVGVHDRALPLADLIGHRVQHGIEDNVRVDAAHAVPLLADLARPHVGPARRHALHHVVDAHRDCRVRRLREHPDAPTPCQGLDLLKGMAPCSDIVAEPLSHCLLLCVRLLIVAHVATAIYPCEARVQGLHDLAPHDEAAGLEVHAVHPLLHVHTVVEVARLRGERVERVRQGRLPCNHLHIHALVAVAELSHTPLSAGTRRPVRVARPYVAVVRLPVSLEVPDRHERLLRSLGRVRQHQAPGYAHCQRRMVLGLHTHVRDPVLARQALPEL
mmetsp:Transcript_73682/g.190092  ORF Transcript_73682/g.190092 Transcript_73682/m.190092 type:complete len:287 (-) Transcript_73682:159-1019(-)